jgi:hypothetical protein
MRISKLYLVICAAALCASRPILRADDNPNQAAARAALEQQMQSMDAQQATPNASSSAPAESAKAAAPAAASTQSPATNPPAAAASSGNSLFGPVPPPSEGLPASAISGQSTSTSNTPTAVQTQTSATNQSLLMEPSQNNDAANKSAKELGLKPIVAPPLPISADKQAQLRALLQKYEAGSISPVEYQVERKKILNLPQ